MITDFFNPIFDDFTDHIAQPYLIYYSTINIWKIGNARIKGPLVKGLH